MVSVRDATIFSVLDMLDRLFFVFSLFRFVIFSSAVFFFAPHDDDDVPLLWRRLDCARVQMTEPISLPL